jgi:hypothetical protein
MLESNPSVAFRRFIREHPRIEEIDIAIEVFFLRWQASRLTESELQQSPESLNRGLAEVSAGRLIDAPDARQQTPNRMVKNREFSRSVYGVRQRALGGLSGGPRIISDWLAERSHDSANQGTGRT